MLAGFLYYSRNLSVVFFSIKSRCEEDFKFHKAYTPNVKKNTDAIIISD